MEIQYRIFIAITVLLFFLGCAEKNNPVEAVKEDTFLLISETQTPGWANDVWIEGDMAYVADHEFGVTIWDVSDSSAPGIVDTILTRGNSKRVAHSAQSDLTFVSGNQWSSFTVYKNKSDILWMFGGTLEDFTFHELDRDTVLIIGLNRYQGIEINTIFFDEDIEEWDSWYYPLCGEIEFDFGSSRGLFYDYETIYVANNEAGLIIVDADYSNPDGIDLSILGSVDTPGAARDVGIINSRTHAIVADLHSGLVIVDVIDKSNPSMVGSILPEGAENAHKLAIKDDIVYFLDPNNGLFTVDVSQPLTPVFLGRYYTPAPMSVFITDDFTIYIADQDLGLIVLEWSDYPR